MLISSRSPARRPTRSPAIRPTRSPARRPTRSPARQTSRTNQHGSSSPFQQKSRSSILNQAVYFNDKREIVAPSKSREHPTCMFKSSTDKKTNLKVEKLSSINTRNKVMESSDSVAKDNVADKHASTKNLNDKKDQCSSSKSDSHELETHCKSSFPAVSISDVKKLVEEKKKLRLRQQNKLESPVIERDSGGCLDNTTVFLSDALSRVKERDPISSEDAKLYVSGRKTKQTGAIFRQTTTLHDNGDAEDHDLSPQNNEKELEEPPFSLPTKDNKHLNKNQNILSSHTVLPDYDQLAMKEDNKEEEDKHDSNSPSAFSVVKKVSDGSYIPKKSTFGQLGLHERGITGMKNSTNDVEQNKIEKSDANMAQSDKSLCENKSTSKKDVVSFLNVLFLLSQFNLESNSKQKLLHLVNKASVLDSKGISPLSIIDKETEVYFGNALKKLETLLQNNASNEMSKGQYKEAIMIIKLLLAKYSYGINIQKLALKAVGLTIPEVMHTIMKKVADAGVTGNEFHIAVTHVYKKIMLDSTSAESSENAEIKNVNTSDSSMTPKKSASLTSTFLLENSSDNILKKPVIKEFGKSIYENRDRSTSKVKPPNRMIPVPPPPPDISDAFNIGSLDEDELTDKLNVPYIENAPNSSLQKEEAALSMKQDPRANSKFVNNSLNIPIETLQQASDLIKRRKFITDYKSQYIAPSTITSSQNSTSFLSQPNDSKDSLLVPGGPGREFTTPLKLSTVEDILNAARRVSTSKSSLDTIHYSNDAPLTNSFQKSTPTSTTSSITSYKYDCSAIQEASLHSVSYSSNYTYAESYKTPMERTNSGWQGSHKSGSQNDNRIPHLSYSQEKYSNQKGSVSNYGGNVPTSVALDNSSSSLRQKMLHRSTQDISTSDTCSVSYSNTRNEQSLNYLRNVPPPQIAPGAIAPVPPPNMSNPLYSLPEHVVNKIVRKF